MDLVLDYAGLQPARLRRAQQREPLLHRRRHRLLAVDVLAGGDRLGQRCDALAGRRRVKKDRKIGLGQRRIEIGGPLVSAEALRNAREPLGVAADQQ